MPINLKKAAFTLAEILITLGIIGIVAEMTIPTIISDTREKSFSVSLKKQISNFQQVTSIIAMENGNLNSWYIGSDLEAANAQLNSLFTSKMKVIKNCGTGTGCMASYYSYLLPSAGGQDIDSNTNYTKFILADRTLVAISPALNASNLSTIIIMVDINGLAPPNQNEKDFFYLTIWGKDYADFAYGGAYANKTNLVLPYGFFMTTGAQIPYCNKTNNNDGKGFYCANWVFTFDNLDYLHCDDLGYNTKHSCD